MKKLLITLALTLVLTGCSTYYAYKGKVYQVTGQGQFGEVVDGKFIPLDDDDLLQRAARDGTQHEHVGPAIDDADRYNQNVRIRKQAAEAKSKSNDTAGANSGDDAIADSRGD